MNTIIFFITFMVLSTQTMIANQVNQMIGDEYQAMVETREIIGTIALTFDDGPGRYTDAILDVLYEHNVKATFFVLGHAVQKSPDTFLRTVEHGHEIGNHTWFHENLPKLTPSGVFETMRRTADLIEQLTDKFPATMRPPFGIFGTREQVIMEELGYSMILWSLDPRDWELRNSQQIYDYVMENVRCGDIILLHDIHESTYKAVAKLVPSLIEKGFDLVTVEQLLEETRPGQVYRRRD
ncbi:MAG: polysaccharide deacetylase family protein [Defluviitaleaceae bacterium]|nr:polysaccharide deacetylase family protein [Defluviitaleaceae bacterium]